MCVCFMERLNATSSSTVKMIVKFEKFKVFFGFAFKAWNS